MRLIKIFCLIFVLTQVNVSSAEWETANNVPLDILQQIMESPDFGGETDSWDIRFKNPREQRTIPDININPMLEKLQIIIASLLRLVLILLIAAMAVLLYIYVKKIIYKKNTAAKKTSLPGIHLKPLKNPKLILQKAMEYYEQGNMRMAWGYCTAAAIISWTVYRGITFPPDATENECADIINSIPSGNKNEAGTFNRLIKNWNYVAYAGKIPPQGSFEEAFTFCRQLGAANG